ncbi:DnaJ domain-containing protein [Rhizoctonia solani]|nr:DnaJ domain-containing protein [Rhizoctonia solani]
MEATDHYTVLGLSRDATTTEIRRSYRAALLRTHPDKQGQIYQESDSAGAAILQIQDAYRILSDPALRTEYDQLLKRGGGRVALTKVAQRPANEVSLDEFTEEELLGSSRESSRWVYPCRCGNQFVIVEEELERGVHYIGCTGCSEVVWVGYEVVDNVSEDEHGMSGLKAALLLYLTPARLPSRPPALLSCRRDS